MAGAPDNILADLFDAPLSPQERRALRLLLTGPVSSVELAARFFEIDRPERAQIRHVVTLISTLRGKLLRYGYDIPRNRGGSHAIAGGRRAGTRAVYSIVGTDLSHASHDTLDKRVRRVAQ